MTILLQWLVEHAWVFYAACAVGIIIYFLRAMAARRERNLALFTLERETATSRLVQSWAMVLVFVAIGAAIFFSTAFILPELPIYSAGTPPPTRTLVAGVEPSTPASAVTPSPTLGSLVPTLTPTAVNAPAPTLPPPEPTEVPTPVPTDTPEVAISGEVRARFSDFAELIGYDLPAGEVTAAQPLPLTLYWRGLEGTSPTNYLVFTHLLSQDGRLIAQHDGPPAGGTRPTSSWTAGEIIADPHPMAFADTAYVGPATIAVGLYDPAVGRIPTDTGADRVVLPITISVIPQ
jgi:hypothetical protein